MYLFMNKGLVFDVEISRSLIKQPPAIKYLFHKCDNNP